jgi:hypothetical protein
MAKANKSFLAIYALCREFPFILWDHKALNDLSQVFLLMHHFDTFDTEEEMIEVAHWAYLYAYRAFELAQETDDDTLRFEALKSLVIIADECNEAFTDTVTQYYLPQSGKISQELISQRRQMASRILPLVTYAIILQIDEHFHSLRDDETLEAVCNTIEMEYGTISDKLTADATLISKMIFRHALRKIQAQDFVF